MAVKYRWLVVTLSLALLPTPAPADGRAPAAPEQQPRKRTAGRTDRYGDPLPEGALARLGTVRLRQGSEITALFFSADGKQLLSYGEDHRVRVWDIASGKAVRSFDTGRERVHDVALAPDGRTIALACGDRVRLWDVRSGSARREIAAPRSAAAVAFSPDGKVLAAVGGLLGGDVRLWDAAAGTPLRTLPHGGQSLAFSPDGRLLAVGLGLGDACVLDAATGKEVYKLPRHPQQGDVCVALSPDGKTLATGCSTFPPSSSVCLSDAATGKRVAVFMDFGPSVAFAPQGGSLAAAGSGLQLWKGGVRAKPRQLDAPDDWFSALAFSPDGKTLAAARGGHAICLWDVATGRRTRPVPGAECAANTLAVAPDGRSLAAAYEDGTLRLWEPDSGKLLRARRLAEQVMCARFSPDGRTLAALLYGGEVQFCVPATLQTRCTVDPGRGGVGPSIAFSPDGKTLAAAADHQLTLWDPATGRERRSFGEDTRTVACVAFSPDGKSLMSVAETLGGDTTPTTLTVWDVDTGNARRRFAGPTGLLQDLLYTPDGKAVLTADSRGMVTLWDVATGKRRYCWSVAGGGDTFAAALSPDGRSLVASRGASVHIWEVATGKERGRFTGHDGAVNAAAFGPDGRWLASASDDTTVLVWDLAGSGPRRLGPGEGPRLWRDLGSADATRACQAMWRLVAAPGDAVALLRRSLNPAKAVDAAGLKRLVADLDDRRFAVRQRATRELAALADAAEPALRAALREARSAESSRRVRALLDGLHGPEKVPEVLQALRAVETLEYIGNAGAGKVLEKVGEGVPWARLTREAKAAFARLRKPTEGKRGRVAVP